MSGQSHAVKIQKYTTVFVKVEGEFSTINWMPIDEDKERGIGYDKYGINTFTYKSSITSIQF